MRSQEESVRPGTRSVLRALVLGAFALASILMVTVRPIVGLSSDLVISQVYGGGGNSGAPYKNDFVEIFNRGTVAASLNGSRSSTPARPARGTSAAIQSRY